MKKILLFILVGFTQINYGQGGEYEDVYPSDVIAPIFDGGGMKKFNDYVNKEFDYSKVTKAGKLETAFTIDEEGTIKNIRVLQILDSESAIEIIRVLKKCPKWIPAKRGGKPFSVKIKYPMVFKMKEKTQIEKNSAPISDVSGKEDPNISNVKIYDLQTIETKPKLQGGIGKFYEFIAKNFIVPDVEGLSGKIIVSFVVEKDGSLTDIEVLKDIGYYTGKEAVRVLTMCPKWKPGMQNGKPVRCQYTLPISVSAK